MAKRASGRGLGGLSSMLTGLLSGLLIAGGVAFYYGGELTTLIASGTGTGGEAERTVNSTVTPNQIELGNLQGQIAEKDTLIANLGAERDRLSVELDRIRTGQSDASDSLQTEIEELRDRKIPELTQELADRDRLVSEMNARLVLAKQVADDLQAQLDAANASARNGLEAQLAQRDRLLEQMDAEIIRLNAVEAEYEKLKAQDNVSDKPDNDQLENIELELADTKSALAEKTAELKELDEGSSALLASLKQSLGDAKKDKDRLNETIRRLESENSEALASGSASSETITVLQQELDQARRKADTSAKLLSDLQDRNSTRVAELERDLEAGKNGQHSDAG